MDGIRPLSKTGDSKDRPMPHNIRSFFWDVDVDGISIVESAHFIIGRLMEHGDENALRFLLKNYSHDELVQVLKNNRAISRRSRIFWRFFLEIDEKSCTPKRYPTPYGSY